MKKILGLFMMFTVVFGLAACGNKNVDTDNVDTVETSNENIETNTNGTTLDLKEYQLNFHLVSSDVDGNEMVMDMDVYQKGNKALYIINEMPEMPDSPIKTLQTLIIDDTSYVQMEVNGESSWFKSEGLDQTQLSDQLFDLEDVQAELEKDADSKQDETIDGKKMTCYYKNDGTQDGKACTYKGIFTYAETTMLDGSDINTIMTVSNYSEKVKDSIFVEPTDAKDMMELMNMMMGEGVE